MFQLFWGLIDRVFVVVGALVFSQAPLFYQAYTQRLGGHKEELNRQLHTLSTLAENSGKSLSEYIGKFVSHLDKDISQQGEFIQSVQSRFIELSSAYQAMTESGLLSRPFHFLQHFQWDIVQATLKDFHLGISFTFESGVYALFGMGFGYFIFFMLHTLLARSRILLRKIGLVHFFG